MAKKVFSYRGKSIEELKKMSIEEFMEIVPSRIRRSLKRGLTNQQKKVLKNLKGGKQKVETHCRDMIILPQMVGKTVFVHKGNKFEPVRIEDEMIGHYLGEFVLTRSRVSHSAPGVGATRSSASMSVR